MSWTDTTRAEHKRICSRYPSDCTDEEWAIIEPLLPPARHGGRPRTTDMRNLFDAILYMAQGGSSGVCYPMIFRHTQRFSATSMTGARAACYPISTLRWCRWGVCLSTRSHAPAPV